MAQQPLGAIRREGQQQSMRANDRAPEDAWPLRAARLMWNTDRTNGGPPGVLRGDIGVSLASMRGVFGGKGRFDGHRRQLGMAAVIAFVAFGATSCSGGSNPSDVVAIQAGQAPPGALP